MNRAYTIDPDCRYGKHLSCSGAPCECPCHTGTLATELLYAIVAYLPSALKHHGLPGFSIRTDASNRAELNYGNHRFSITVDELT